MRRDIKGVLQQSAWAGQGRFPFGMYDCPGWLAPLRRLSDAFASARRNSHLTGVLPALINVRPFTSDGEYAVISYRLDVLHSRPQSAHEQARLRRLVAKTRRNCSGACQLCGKPALPAILGGIWCPDHAPAQFAFEVVRDQRQMNRIRRRWLNLCRGTLTKYTECHSGVCLPLYNVDGAHFVCISDAPPGFRQQTLELMIELGMHPTQVEGEWLIRSFRRSKST